MSVKDLLTREIEEANRELESRMEAMEKTKEHLERLIGEIRRLTEHRDECAALLDRIYREEVPDAQD